MGPPPETPGPRPDRAPGAAKSPHTEQPGVEGRFRRAGGLHVGLRQYFADLAEQGVESEAALAELRDLGDRVVGLGRLSFKSAIGVELPDQGLACIWEWRAGKCVEAPTWLSHAERLRAAGHSK